MGKEIKSNIPDANSSQNYQISHSASKIAIGGVLSLTVGLVNQVVIAWLFGAGKDMDAYLTALVIPLTFAYALIFGLSFVLIPAFIEEESQGSEEDAWSLVGTFFWLTLGVLTLIAIIGSFFSDVIINITAPGLSPEKAIISARMLSILMFTVPLVGLGSLSRGIQNARNSFFWPSAAGIFGSIGSAATLLILYQFVGSMSLAWSSLVSEFLIACMTVIPILRHGWLRLMPIYDKKILGTLRLVIPFILLNFIITSTRIFQRYFASGLPDGDLSYIGYASKIEHMLIVVLAAGIADAIFPTMARAYSQNGVNELIKYSEYGLRLSVASGLPAITILGVVAVPLITIFYERGAFTHADTVNVSNILFIVLSIVLFRMLGNVISRTFYVIKDTVTYPLISAISVVFYIIFGYLLTNSFGYVGLALAKPLQMSLMVLTTFIFLSKKLPGLHNKLLFADMLVYTFASIVAAIIALLLMQTLGFLPLLFQVIVACGISGFIYILILLWKDRNIALSVLELFYIPEIISIVRNGYRKYSTYKREI